MSAPKVDVLAVMADARNSMGMALPGALEARRTEMAEARAAVAELIEVSRYTQDCLQRGLEIDWPECTCEDCPECGEQPTECSGTDCSQTCQCSLCDHCCATGAADALRAAIARIGGAA